VNAGDARLTVGFGENGAEVGFGYFYANSEALDGTTFRVSQDGFSGDDGRARAGSTAVNS
jgi:hypothetical protein